MRTISQSDCGRCALNLAVKTSFVCVTRRDVDLKVARHTAKYGPKSLEECVVVLSHSQWDHDSPLDLFT